MDITYNINNPRALNLGYQYDHNVKTVTFTGFTPVDDTNTIYLKYEGLGLYPLYDMSFVVSQSFTLKDGTFKGQLFEVASDNTLVQNSDTFNMMVKPSISEDTEIVPEDASLSLWFTEMSDLYNTVLNAYESGTLVTYDNVVAALGYTPANEDAIEPVPENVSAFNNDAGYITEITATDIKDAINDARTNLLDIQSVIKASSSGLSFSVDDTGLIHMTGSPSTSSLYVTSYFHIDPGTYVICKDNYHYNFEINVSYETSDGMGGMGKYTGSQVIIPGSSGVSYDNNLTITINDDWINVMISIGFANITVGSEMSDTIHIWMNAGGAAQDFVKYERIDISSFPNDAGYITGITSKDITDALGYVPADEDHVVVTIDSEDVTNALGYIPANKEDIPVVPTVVSAFTNDSGYINEITSDDILDALGYIPADVNLGNYELIRNVTIQSAASVITISEDNEGNEFGLDGATIVISSDNGIGGGTNSYLYAYDASNNLVGSSRVFFYGGASVTECVIEIERKGAIVEMKSIGYLSSSPYSPVNKSLMFSDELSGRIAKIELYGNGQAFATNTSVSLFGYKVSSSSSSNSFSRKKSMMLNASTDSVIINTDEHNNVLDLDDAAVIISNSNGIGGGSNGYIYFYDADNSIVGSQLFFAGGASMTNVAIKLERRGNIIEMDSIGWNSGASYSPANKSLITASGNAGKIAEIGIYGNGHSINSGTVINIYGV